MNHWRNIFALLLIAGFSALVFSNDAKPGTGKVTPEQMAVYVISVPSHAVHTPGEQASNLVVPSPNNLSSSIHIKDFQKHIDNLFTQNQDVERSIHSYIFYTQSFPAAESLSKLRRLNI